MKTSKTHQQDCQKSWPRDIHSVLGKFDIRQVCYVPDAGHSDLIKLCQNDKMIKSITLATEEEGVALLLGAWLGGERGVILMQSSGVGNIINMLGLAKTCRYPVLMLITMRGEWGEFNPWQNPMGQACRSVLEAIGTKVLNIDDSVDIVETVSAGAKLAFNGQQAVAIILSQKLLGAKTFQADVE
tara:strand:- start:44 stop:598 length:555 start_codon:yes stop_codon:yes gene_type:complete